MNRRVPIVISNRYIQLSQSDAEKIFGPRPILTPLRQLSQPGYFATHEQLKIKGPKGSINNIRIIGPWVKRSQVVILKSDIPHLGVSAPLRIPGDLKNSGSIEIIGPLGSIKLSEGLIIAKKYLCVTVSDAQEFGLRHGQYITIKTGDRNRGLTFHNVIVQVRDSFVLDFHIGKDEASSTGIERGAWGEIID